MSNWALILGASSGIGASCARELAKKGVNIYGVYLRKKSNVIEELTNELKELSMNNFPNEKVYDLLENSHLDHKDIEDYIQFSEEKYTRHLS